jgi:non-heme chloroperoxidase
MGTITTSDDTQIFYKDWGSGQPVVFSHGWPLNADAWDDQAMLVASNGYRAVAHDRRAHGRSSQPWTGHDLDTYADDLAQLIEQLDLQNVVLVGHSTGGGEVTRYVGRHGTGRVAKAVLVGAIPPLMLKTDANPQGTPIEAFDAIRQGVAGDRSQFYQDLSAPFYGANRPGSTVSRGVRDSFWLWSMQVGLKGAYDCVKAFSETDLTEDLRRIDVPTLGSAVGGAGQGRDPEGVSRRPPRPVRHPQGAVQRRPARLPPDLSSSIVGPASRHPSHIHLVRGTDEADLGGQAAPAVHRSRVPPATTAAGWASWSGSSRGS